MLLATCHHAFNLFALSTFPLSSNLLSYIISLKFWCLFFWIILYCSLSVLKCPLLPPLFHVPWTQFTIISIMCCILGHYFSTVSVFYLLLVFSLVLPLLLHIWFVSQAESVVLCEAFHGFTQSLDVLAYKIPWLSSPLHMVCS